MTKDVETKNKKYSKNEKKSEDKNKQRGRPKKLVSQQSQQSQQQKIKIIDMNISKEKNPINLHIPLYDDSSETSEKNQFTMNNESAEEKKNLIVYLSEEESSDDDNIKSLKTQLKKKDNLIKKLKNEINNKSECFNESHQSISKNTEQNKKIKIINTTKDCKVNVGEKTNIACWWCTLQFDNLPCFIPEKYHNEKYFVFGCFCSYNCSLAYIMNDDEYKISNRIALVKRLYSELYDTEEPLYPSPQKELLTKYGGPLSTEEYKNVCYKLEQKKYKMKFPEIYQIPFYFEETNKEYTVSKYM